MNRNIKNGLGFLVVAALLGSSSFSATIQSSNIIGNGANSVFDSSGNLIPNETGLIRVGTFSTLDAAGVSSAFSSGDLAGLNADFIPFSNTTWNFGNGFGFNGTWDIEVGASIGSGDPLIGGSIVTWATTASSFTDLSGELFIFEASTAFFAEDNPTFIGASFVGDGLGSILVGDFGNFFSDLGGGAGSQAGFNTVEVIPEPSTYALMALGGLALVVGYGRKKRN